MMESAAVDRGSRPGRREALDLLILEQFRSHEGRRWRTSDLVRILPGSDVVSVSMSLERLERRGRLVRCEPGCYRLGVS